jgi:hypothetical protein
MLMPSMIVVMLVLVFVLVIVRLRGAIAVTGADDDEADGSQQS